MSFSLDHSLELQVQNYCWAAAHDNMSTLINKQPQGPGLGLGPIIGSRNDHIWDFE